MEPQKDITLKDNQPVGGQLDTRKIAIFENDSDFYVIHKKVEKLAVATYMISNFFTTEEPLKWSLRRVSTELVKDTVSLSSASLSLKDGLVRILVAKIIELISLYEIADKAGFISPMNSKIITEELNKILLLLNKREAGQVGTKSLSFDESFFAVPQVKEESVSQVKDEPVSLKTPSWQTPSVSQKQTPFPHVSHAAPSYAYQSQTQVGQTGVSAAKNTVSFIKDNQNQKDIKDKRQSTIIALVKKHRTLTIKGFTSVIKGCSEKTIQRELLALVAKGVLKKEGERRWSTYSLA